MIPRLFFASPIAALVYLLASLETAAQNGEWTQWRGADRSNASEETGLLQEWPPEGPPLVWLASGIGYGIHSVSIAGGRLFTVGTKEECELTLALDANTGRKLWATPMGSTIAENAQMRWLTQRTPTVDGDRVYAFSSRGELFCLASADGRKIWQRSYRDDFGARHPGWGYCDRPLVDGNRLICTPFGTEAFIVALDKRTGDVIWKTNLGIPPGAGHAALTTADIAGVRQYIVFHGEGLSGFAADDGRRIWDYARPATRVARSYTPLIRGGDIYSPNGYGGGLVAIQVIRNADRFETRELYQHNSSLFQFDAFQDSTALVGDHLYALSHRVPVCIELKTGTETWKSNPEPQGAAVAQSHMALTYADNCLYFQDVDGTVSLLRVSPEARSLEGHFKLPDTEHSLGVTAPVVAGARLYLRDSSRLFCYDVSAGGFETPRARPLETTVELTAPELRDAREAARDTHDAPNGAKEAIFIATPQDVTERMLQEAAVKKEDLVIDLGSGDGRIVITAAKTYGCKAIGYEIDPRLVDVSRSAVIKEKLQQLVSIKEGSFFAADLSGASVITAFLSPDLMARLMPQFEKLRPGTRIVSHYLELPGVKPDRVVSMQSEETGESHRILIWTTPLKKQ